MAQIVAVGLLIVAYLVRDSQPAALIPAWFALVLLAVFLFFSARQEESQPVEEETDSGEFGYDFSEGYSSLEHRHRREAGRQRQRQIEADEEDRVDGILARVHERGIESLSKEERALLERVSARYRSRLNS